MIKKTFLFSSVCLLLTVLQACVSEEALTNLTINPQTEEWEALSFSTQIGKLDADRAATRTVNAGSQWVAGDSIGIFMMGNTSGYTLANSIESNRIYINQGGTSLFGSATAGQTIYQPVSSQYPLKFISVYPYKAVGTGAGMISPAFIYPVDVSNQKDTAHIDVLYSDNNSYTPVQLPPAGMVTSVHLQFEHKLSKVIVNVKKKAGADVIIPGMTAMINGMPLTADLDLNAGTILWTGSKESVINLVSIRTTAGYDTTFQAIVIPHLGTDMTSKVQLFTTRKQFTWQIPTTFQFAPGMIYTFNLTLDGDAVIEFTADISEWMSSGITEDDTLLRDNNGTESKKVIADGADMLDVVYINRGDFSMGDAALSNARPHPVTLTHAFLMTQYEITNAQYAKFLNSADGIVTELVTGDSYKALMDVSSIGANMPGGNVTLYVVNNWGIIYNGGKWIPVAGQESYPANNVSYYGARAYANWAGGDLPTSAQWEYAARAGNTAPFINGLTSTANLWNQACWNNSSSSPKAVGGAAYKNGWNLYDISGNVWEWCKDTTPSSPLPDYSGASETDPLTETGSYAIIRGGAYVSTDADDMRLGYRAPVICTAIALNIGFRIIFPMQ